MIINTLAWVATILRQGTHLTISTLFSARIATFWSMFSIFCWPCWASNKYLSYLIGLARYLLLALCSQQKIETLDGKIAILPENAVETAKCVSCLLSNRNISFSYYHRPQQIICSLWHQELFSWTRRQMCSGNVDATYTNVVIIVYALLCFLQMNKGNVQYNIQIYIRLTAAIFRGLQTFAGPPGQQPIFSWPSGPATGLVRPEVAHSLLWPKATTSWVIGL